MIDNNVFDSIKIGLASPEQMKNGLTAKLKSPRQLTIVLSSLKETACSANAFSDRQRTGNVTAVNTRESVLRVKSVTVAVLK